VENVDKEFTEEHVENYYDMGLKCNMIHRNDIEVMNNGNRKG
jgi:hypothetical protein